MSDSFVSAYYYSFNLTGEPHVDELLRRLARAGKAYHHTDMWTEPGADGGADDGPSHVEMMQSAANKAAARIVALEAVVAALEPAAGRALAMLHGCLQAGGAASPADDEAREGIAECVEQLRAALKAGT